MTTHIVKQGECLSSIAAHYGFRDWRTIYNDPSNAEFRAKRPNPNLIYPNDAINIPDLEPRKHPCPTGKRHTFIVGRQLTYVNIRVQSLAKQPIANAAYTLELDGRTFEGTTDGDGWIKSAIPARSEFGTLSLWPDPDDDEEVIRWTVRLGHLDPLETTSGVKGRLNNLGYECGEINDEKDELYEAAVRQFQEDHGLVVDGIVGPKTRAALEKEHRV